MRDLILNKLKLSGLAITKSSPFGLSDLIQVGIVAK